jgi:hypothetical protein
VRLQATACGLLVCRRLQWVRQQMLEAILVGVDLGTQERDLALSDGHQQPRQPMSPSASMVCVPRATNFNSTAAAVRKALPSSSARVHCKAPPHSATSHHEGASNGHCCDLLQVAIHVLPFRPYGVHGIQVAGCTHASPMRGCNSTSTPGPTVLTPGGPLGS